MPNTAARLHFTPVEKSTCPGYDKEVQIQLKSGPAKLPFSEALYVMPSIVDLNPDFSYWRVASRLSFRIQIVFPARCRRATASAELRPSSASAVQRRRCRGLCRLFPVWFVSGGGVAQQRVRQLELIPPRTGRRHGDLDPSHADPDQAAQLQQLQPDRATGRLGELGECQADAA